MIDATADRVLLPTHGRDRRRALLRLAPTLGRRRSRFLAVTGATAAARLGALGTAIAAAWMVGRAVDGDGAGDLTAPTVVLLVAVAVRVVAVWVEMWLAHDLAYLVMADIRLDVFDGLERLAPGRLLGHRTGDLAAAAMGDVESLEWFYAHAVAQFVVLATIPVTAVGILTVVDGRLAATLAPFVLAVVTVPFWLARRADQQGAALRSNLGELNADAVDAVQGLRELVAFGAADAFRARLDLRSQRLSAAQRAHGSRSGFEAAAGDALVAFAMVAVLAVAAALAHRGDLADDLVPMVAILAGASLAPITEIVGGLRNLGVLRAAAARVYAVADAPATVADLPAAGDAVGDAPDVCFDNVHFRYGDGQPSVLRGVTFRVGPGETIALVGRSGAGKSTCAHLLLRFWDPDHGSVSLGGHDLRGLTQAAVRRSVSLVPQDAYLFNDSIAENIRLGRPDATDDDVGLAARRALVTEFTDDLPDGLDTVVGERGATLSGGQRQRVAIARALLRDSPVLVLDEAVSNLDTVGERALQRALDEARTGRATIVIAHRLSTIRAADRVVVLADGRVLDEGTHGELLGRCQEYRDLVTTQAVGGP